MIRPNLSIWLTRPTPDVMLMGMQVLSPTFAVLIFATEPSASVVHPPVSLNSGNRSFGTSAGVASSFVAVVLVLLLICTGEDVSPLQGWMMWGPWTQGDALGWYGIAPLARKSAMKIQGQRPDPIPAWGNAPGQAAARALPLPSWRWFWSYGSWARGMGRPFRAWEWGGRGPRAMPWAGMFRPVGAEDVSDEECHDSSSVSFVSSESHISR